ncbi:hypothetical protein [Luteimonas sp. A478]
MKQSPPNARAPRLRAANGQAFWSPGYGALVDRFGVPWMVNTFSGEDGAPAQD